MTRLTHIALVLAWLGSTSLAIAQQGKGIIVGQVFDGGLSAPLPFANVGINSLALGTVTDLEGNFRLTNVPAGTYQIEFSYLGYQAQSQEVTVVAGEEIEVNATLDEGVSLG